MKSLVIKEQSIPVAEEADVVVLGSGSAGVAAAVSAARSGLKTVIVEKAPYPGGLLTFPMPLMGCLDLKGNLIVHGVFEELMDKLKKMGGRSDYILSPRRGVSMVITDTELMKHCVLEMLVEARVKLYLHTYFVESIVEQDKIKAIVVVNKSGKQAIAARQFIDCSGDGDLVAASGAPYNRGDANTGETQVSTLLFVMGNVDIKKFKLALTGYPEKYVSDIVASDFFARNDFFLFVGMKELIRQVRTEQGLDLPNDRLSIIPLLRQDEAICEVTRVHIDATDGNQLTDGEIETRKQVFEYIKLLNKWIPGFENSYLKVTAPQLGVRESRRIQGKYTLTGDDVLSARRFSDEIALGCFGIDVHSKNETKVVRPEKSPFGIPYGCLIPAKVNNLLVAGRNISTTREAHAATRVMATCMGTGHAAGCAAAIAVESNISPGEIDYKVLRSRLKEQNAYLPDYCE